jgi:hypothetical protein
MTDHSRFRELAALRLDFLPDAGEAKELAAHLAACVECRRYAGDLQADQDLVRSRAGVHAPDRVRRAVVDRAYGSAPRVGVGRLLPLVAAVIVALALLARSGWLIDIEVAGPGPLSQLTWTRLAVGSGLDGGVVTDVSDTGTGLIAVGVILSPAAAGAAGPANVESAAVWTTDGGTSWTRLQSDPAFAGAGALNAVVRDGKLLMLAVNPAPITALLPLREPLSVDQPVVYRAWLASLAQLCGGCPGTGDAWHATSIDVSRGGASTSFFADATSTSTEFVLVGALYPADVSPHGLTQPLGALIATSTDGTTWRFNDPLSPEFAGGSIQGIADGPAGLVAVGDTELSATIWASADAVSWTPVDGAILSPGASVRGVASSPDGYVAVGDAAGSAASWVSPDGRTWTAGAGSSDLAGARMIHVDWLGSEYVATGTAVDGTGMAWRSVDGSTWTRVEPGFTFGVLETAGRVGARELLFGADAAGTAVAIGEPSGQP